jgi:hypothetical protein
MQPLLLDKGQKEAFDEAVVQAKECRKLFEIKKR